jgi:hypothetical protein
MIVRIDTTNITRGREFTLYAKNPSEKPVLVKAVNALTMEVVDIPYTHLSLGEFDGYEGIAPPLDGYLLSKIGTQKVVKKIGNPVSAFALGYKANYTVAFKAYNGAGVELIAGNLLPLGDGFYFTHIPTETAVVKTLNKNFIVNKNLLKMNYDVTIFGGELNSTYDTPVLENVVLQAIDLPDVQLGTATLDSTLPEVTITEL